MQQQVRPPPLTSDFDGHGQSCPFVNVLRELTAQIHVHDVWRVCMPVHVYGHSDRCWTAIVMDFNIYWVELPTGGWHKLLAGCNCKYQEAWKGQQCNRAKKSWWVYKGGRCATGVHGSSKGIQDKSVTVGIEKRVGTSAQGTWCHGSLECMVCTWGWEFNYKLSDQPIRERVTASRRNNSDEFISCSRG